MTIATVSKIAVSKATLAVDLEVSESHIDNLQASGRLPAPVKLGRLTRWLRSDIELWLELGAPRRLAFETIRDERRLLRHRSFQ